MVVQIMRTKKPDLIVEKHEIIASEMTIPKNLTMDSSGDCKTQWQCMELL